MKSYDFKNVGIFRNLRIIGSLMIPGILRFRIIGNLMISGILRFRIIGNLMIPGILRFPRAS